MAGQASRARERVVLETPTRARAPFLTIGAIALLVIAVVAGACGGSAPSPTPGPATPSPTRDPGASIPPGTAGFVLPSPGPLPAAKKRTFAAAADAEVVLVDRLRAAAGMASLIGSDGDVALQAVDTAHAAYAAKALAAYARQFDLVVPAGGAKGRTPATIALMLGLFASAIARSDTARSPAALTSSETLPPRAAGGVKVLIKLATRVTFASGSARVSGDVEITSTAVLSNVSTGREIGRLTSTLRGHLEVGACPGADGLGEGRASFAIEEKLTTQAGREAEFSGSIDAPFRLVNGEDAVLARAELRASVAERVHGPGSGSTEPADWDAAIDVPIDVAPSGGVEVDPAAVAVRRSDATQAQFDEAYGAGIAQSALIVGLVGAEAEGFWRSGRCVELTSSRPSGVVGPNEKVNLSVSAVQRFDAQPVAAPIAAVFAGAKSLAPPKGALDPPATFVFQAGTKPGQKGTIELTQASRRGIGRATIVLTVRDRDLVVTVDGTYGDEKRLDVRVALPKVRLVASADGRYVGTGRVQVASTYTGGTSQSGICTGSVELTADVTIVAQRDAKDRKRIRLAVTYAYVPIPYVATCAVAGILRDDAGKSVRSWVSPLLNQVVVKLDTPASVRRGLGGGLTSSARITVADAP